MTEEDLDELLERAEKVETVEHAEGGANADLLNSFKVANPNFTQEDDSSFWSRLLGPVQVQPQEALMPRSATINQPKSYAENTRGGNDGAPSVSPCSCWFWTESRVPRNGSWALAHSPSRA
jgi:hypothetical protein